MSNNFYEQLSQMALERSIPFCVGCYREAPTGLCPSCGSDDLAKLVRGDGMDWGTDWIIRSIVESELTPVNVDEAFEESVRLCGLSFQIHEMINDLRFLGKMAISPI